MRTTFSLLLSLVLPLSLAACGGSDSGSSSGGASGGSSGGNMFIESCSLGCSSGSGGAQVVCAIDQTFQNQEVSVRFSQPVDIGSVNSQSFQLINVGLGTVPLGSYNVDPLDPRRLIFRPAVTFSASGQLQLGFQAGETYRITIPGTSQSPNGPYVQSTSGKPNRSLLRCDIRPNGIVDVVPGNPTVSAFVDIQLFDGGGNPTTILQNQPAQGATDVSQNSDVTIIFADIMNPLTLFSPATNTSDFVIVSIDRDGDPLTISDQSALFGSYMVFVDQAQSRTILTFTPSCIPSGGLGGRAIVITFRPGIADLAGNPLAPTNPIVFTPETSTVAPLRLPDADGENFADTTRLDARASGGNMWHPEDPLNPGQFLNRLVRGFGGGSGRHGALRIGPGETVTIDTGNTTFPSATFPLPGIEYDLITNAIAGVDYTATNQSTWPQLMVSDGRIEFSSIDIKSGGTLVLLGTPAAQLFSRGTIQINGLVDAGGRTPAPHLGDVIRAQGARGGPNAASGGAGSTRKDLDLPPEPFPPAPSPFVSMCSILTSTALTARPMDLDCFGGIMSACAPLTAIPECANPAGVVESLVGQPGGEVALGVPPTTGIPPANTAGLGGTSWPNLWGVTTNGGGLREFRADPTTLNGFPACISKQTGPPGSGGGYVNEGGQGIPVNVGTSDLGPTTSGGLNGIPNTPNVIIPGGLAVPLEPADPEVDHYIRKLNPEIGHLRGGSGGGGGGTNFFGSTYGTGFPCGNLTSYIDNSGAPGGGGGGGVQLTSGNRIELLGQVRASGGAGGSAGTTAPGGGTDRRNVTPGGGGSGGSVRLQARVVNIASTGTRIDVRGGAGGVGAATMVGGAGSRGLVRLEQIAESQIDPELVIDRDSEASKVAPYNAADPLDSREHMSAGRWIRPRSRPDAFSGATSCWIKPDLSDCFLELVFEEDAPASTDPDDFGWNMNVIYDSGSGEQVFPYRGIPDDPSFPLLQSIQDTIGNELGDNAMVGGGSVVVVRFQGAVSREQTLSNLCDVELTGFDADIVTNSLTPWVSHPAELNQFIPRPNMIRYTIIFDGTLTIPNTFNDFIKGVTDLRIEAQPD